MSILHTVCQAPGERTRLEVRSNECRPDLGEYGRRLGPGTGALGYQGIHRGGQAQPLVLDEVANTQEQGYVGLRPDAPAEVRARGRQYGQLAFPVSKHMLAQTKKSFDVAGSIRATHSLLLLQILEPLARGLELELYRYILEPEIGAYLILQV